MKKFTAISLVIFLLLAQSCTQKPFACFNTDVNEDSIHVNRLITFTSACSTNADSYFWEFNNNDDSIFFTPNVQKTFYDTGTVHVYLLVTGGRNVSAMSKDIRVNP